MARFRPGQSGNPAGRPPGTGKIDKLRAMLEPSAEALVGKAVELALAGDTTALRLCLDRCIPVLKSVDPPVQIDLGDGTLTDQGRAVMAAMATGALTPDQAGAILQGLGGLARLAETDDMQRRIAALEEKLGAR